MEAGKPSRTARAAAIHRAAHHVVEHGRIFIAARTRFTEDALAAAVSRGVSQLVVLGAGLDTFAYRSPFGKRLRIFEVSHPATQEWKLGRLEEAGIRVPQWLTFAPIVSSVRLWRRAWPKAASMRRGRLSFTWLGVVRQPGAARRECRRAGRRF